MVIMKMIFVVLLSIPIGYISIVLLSKLIDSTLKNSK